MIKFSFWKFICFSIAVAIALIFLSPSISAKPIQARQADKFIDSICVCTHPWYEWERIEPKLRELGIRHIRDGGQSVNFVKEMYEKYGIKYTMVVELENFEPSELLDYVKSVGTEKFDGISGLNEPFLFVKQGDWKETARSIQQQLWKTIKGDRQTKRIPILTFSPVFPKDAIEVGNVSAWADYADIHLYYGGKNPETIGNIRDNVYWKFRLMANAIAPGKPVIMTETGYHNTRQVDDHKGTPDLAVVAKYIPRLYLTHFKQGIVRSCIYELYDEGTNPNEQEHNFGLLRHDYSNKPSFEAVKNAIALLKDPGAEFTPGRLNYRLSGNTNNLETLLLQKRNGNFFLAMWLGVSSFNPNSQSAFDVSPQTVTVSLSNTVSRVVLHQLSAQGQISARKITLSNGKLTMPVSDTVTFVEIEGNLKQ